MSNDVSASGISTATRAPATNAPPKPWLAALLGVLWPGAGHLYAGEVRRASVLAMIQLAALPILAWFMVAAGVGVVSLYAPLLAYLCFRVWVLIDGWRAANRGRGATWSARRRWIVLVAATAGVWLVLELELTVVRRQLARAVRIPSQSMEPTILSGDYLLLSPLDAERVTRGALIVWRDETRGGEFVHRVIGLPGDTLRMTGTTLWRNGRELPEPYARYEQASASMGAETPMSDTRTNERSSNDAIASRMQRASNWGPFVVPPDSVFVLGDNRDRSADSRFFGPVPLDRVVAKPLKVYFSRDAESGAIRWGRVGLEL